MRNRKETIRKFVSMVNNEEEQGGFWLPNIQRYFVWRKDQIEKLFDSIMREYPIGNFLIWKTREPVKMRKFIDNYKGGIKLTDFYVPKNEKMKLLVLDGQQRLQSLFIALKGSYNGEELYFNVLSGKEEKEDIKFEFKFLNPAKADVTKGWVKVKDIVYDNREYDEITEEIVEKINSISEEEKRLIRKNILKLIKEFRDKENIAYTELDSVDNPDMYTLNDVVEIFIRANSGGTPLSKSDLMFSLLTANWEEIEEDLTYFLEDLNSTAFAFERDFVLKTSLILIGTGAKYDVMKFRKEENLEKLQNNWDEIKKSIKEIKDFLCKYTFIRDDKALPSYLALIPLIYFNYKYPDKWKTANKEELAKWLTRVLLTGTFSGSSDTLLDALIKKVDEKEDFDIDVINTEIINRGRTINISEESLLDSYYGDKKLYLIFALWYQDVNFKPAYEGNLPWVDHIFPQSKLKEVKVVNPETGRKVIKYKQWERDQIANLMLLSAEENRDEKRNKPPDEWLKGKDDKYFEIHLIPKDKKLWKIDNFEEFIEARKKLIVDKFRKMRIITN
ncbi:protein of unknown function DUF262 [Thermodesulfatator indicus DSM 15286]|uniref:DUF262 domain-containing protein n=1 Tax=Thermodesulfatator indicus (strain DSM 15286 / JCM 11887 / CIR29812) TaxID=667014 RepID=F8A9K3_THEID|nr:DUF262 domain-containing protein [Thermodesulfatator indicus]AEH45229.1 protein of unknown function DUF262 [Thermodesulfatator indicus DSM 15286]